MNRRARENHSPALKAKVAIEASGDGQTVGKIAHRHDVHPNQVTEWRRQLLERAAVVPEPPRVDFKELHEKIGQLTLDNVSLDGALGKAGLLSAKR